MTPSVPLDAAKKAAQFDLAVFQAEHDRAALDAVVSGNWDEFRSIGNALAARLEAASQ